MVKDKTLYDRLEIDSNASDNDIKKAFNRLSKLWHPDKRINEDKNIVTQKFQEINQAKEILLDPEKRELYDRIGMDILKGDINENSFENLFNGFPNGFPFDLNNGKKIKKENIVKTLDVTLEQIYNEEIINYTYQQKQYCQTCNGEGTQNGLPNICPKCNGKGIGIQILRIGMMVQQTVGNCQNCNGTGQLKDKNNMCNICKGNCFLLKSKNIQIPLKAGLSNNNKINLTGKGHIYKDGKSDLILTINELPHLYYKRYENDLYIEIILKLHEALFGFNKIITHLDGRKLNISCTNYTPINMIRKIENEGIKFLQGDKKGNLYINFTVNIPNLQYINNDLKDKLLSLLQSVDTPSINSTYYTDIKHNSNIDSINNRLLYDCNKDESEEILYIFNSKLNSNTNDNNDAGSQNAYHANINECTQS